MYLNSENENDSPLIRLQRIKVNKNPTVSLAVASKLHPGFFRIAGPDYKSAPATFRTAEQDQLSRNVFSVGVGISCHP